MSKILAGIAGFIVLSVGTVFLFKSEVKNFIRENITIGMFIEADTDSYDEGLPVGSMFPSIKASYRGAEIASIQQFMGTNGLVLFANRSVDW